MPGAADDPACEPVRVRERRRRQRRTGQRPLAERAPLMRTSVVERVVAPVDVEDADAAPADLPNDSRSRRELGGRAYEMTPARAHDNAAVGSATSLRRGRS